MYTAKPETNEFIFIIIICYFSGKWENEYNRIIEESI